MNDDSDEREGQTGAHAKNPRADRLKLALRENLKRRKSQARARSHVTIGVFQSMMTSHHMTPAEKSRANSRV